MSWLVSLLATLEPEAKLTLAVPVAIALNFTVETSLSPVLGVIVPRSIFTDPPPPVLCA